MPYSTDFTSEKVRVIKMTTGDFKSLPMLYSWLGYTELDLLLSPSSYYEISG